MPDPMKYGKARGASLLKKYLPRVTPFSELDLISTPDEWNAVKGKYGGFAFQRVDWPLEAKKPKTFYGTSGRPEDIPDLLARAQADSPDAAILLLLTKDGKKRYRYEYDGGFNVLFALGREIVIELVGKGFDGHELTYGLAVHESYTIPWDLIPWVTSKNKLPNNVVWAQTWYPAQRKERIRYLVEDCGYNAELVEKSVPTELRSLDDSLFCDLLDNIVMEFYPYSKEAALRRDGLELFCVQGNFVDGKIQPWEIFDPRRWQT